ncbi:MAG: hypothetical protein PVG66_13455 [Chromatiales bacterium]|jgi:hypothetical protein
MIETILGLGAFSIALTGIIWFMPIVLIATSSRTTGLEKLAWLLLVLFFSWFSWILYLLIAPLSDQQQTSPE